MNYLYSKYRPKISIIRKDASGEKSWLIVTNVVFYLEVNSVATKKVQVSFKGHNLGEFKKTN